MQNFSQFIPLIESSLLEDYAEKKCPQGILDEDAWFTEGIRTGQLEKLLESDGFKNFIALSFGDDNLRVQEVVGKLIEKKLDCSKSAQAELEVLVVGIAALCYFIQLNWTGPNTEDKYEWLSEKGNEIKLEMALDAENLSPLVEGTQWLLLARAVFIQNCSSFNHLKALAAWWSLRCIYVHQNVLEDASSELHSLIDERLNLSSELLPWLAKLRQMNAEPSDTSEEESKPLESLDTVFPELKDHMFRDLRTLFWTELVQLRLCYGQVHKARICLEQALDSSKMQLSLTGAMGKRTFFQVKELAQLTLKVDKISLSENSTALPIDVKETLPANLTLDDDLRLPQIDFSVKDEGKYPTLTPVEQCVVLASFSLVVKSQPKDAITEEEVVPYLNCVLSNPLIWSNQLFALLSRCKLESNHRRTIERSMTQAQLLADSIFKKKPDASVRLQFLFASHLPPHWKIQVELASLLISVGAINSALDIFIRLQQWDDIVACYHLLELRHKAADVVKAEIEKKPSVKLYCMLGDATDEVTSYEKAWELSGHKSAKAQRHWGLHFYRKKEFDASIEHLEKSLELNSLQPMVMSKLAFMYLEKEDWSNCAKVYRKLCNLDGENFEAWNNLSKAYVKLGEKARAWKTLQESTKCNYENWQVWDNVMVVSIDCAEYQEALRAYHRLLDLRGTHVDIEVLEILVKAVVEDLPDNHGRSSARLRKKALELFGRLSSVVPNNAKIWQLYAQLSSNGPEANAPITLEKVVQFLQRAQRCATQAPKWCQESSSCIEAINIMLSLANTCIELCEKFSTPAEKMKILASPRLAMKSMQTKIKMEHTDAVTGEIKVDLADSFGQLSAKLDEIVTLNSDLQNLL